MRALIVKTSSLGDVLHTFGLVEYLKAKGVKRVGWVVEKTAAPLVRAHPGIDTVIEIDSSSLRSLFPRPAFFGEFLCQKREIKKEKWDILFDLQANCKSGLVTFLARANKKVGYGKRRVAEWPNLLSTNMRLTPPDALSVRSEYLWFAQEYFRDHSPFLPSPVQLLCSEGQKESIDAECARWPHDRPVWIIAPGSRWKSKTCRFEALASLLTKSQDHFSPHYIFVAGTPEEHIFCKRLEELFPQISHVLFKPDLVVLQHIMGRAGVVVSMDSLALHLAATTNTPTFGLFGPSSAARYGPEGSRHGIYQGACPFHEQFERRCARLRSCSTAPCLHDADPSEIFESLSAWYRR